MPNMEIENAFDVADFFDVGERHLGPYAWEGKCQSLKALKAAEDLQSLLEAPSPAKRIPYSGNVRVIHHTLPRYPYGIGHWAHEMGHWSQPAWEVLGAGTSEGGLRRRSISTARIEQAIKASRQILSLSDNWDDEGSPGYAEHTWERATQFVRRVATAFIAEYKRLIEPPKITPGPDGSIDVRWKSAKRTLLVNFPANEDVPADFFGSDKGKDTIKGTLDLSSQNLWLLMWLTR